MHTARDIMTKEVITTTPATSVTEVAGLLDKHRISGVPVVDQEDWLVGVITQSDLVSRARDLELPPAIALFDLRLFLETPSHFKKRLEKMLGTTVGDVMTPKPITVYPETPVSQIADLMAKKKVHTIPVVEAGKLVGVIGKIDLIRAQAREPGE
ncbi:MAG: CBS domain-containing protein [Deltaproteobacteria bacterium]|nr:CBS domain-containing protein [Deltaproteobacteria bacterium]MBI4794757.1 CBS domain-containing protein [Deltaproteobacteria bacterium]